MKPNTKKLSDLPDMQAENIMAISDDICIYINNKLEESNANIRTGLGIHGIAVAKFLAIILKSQGVSKENVKIAVTKYFANVMDNVEQFYDIFEEIEGKEI